MKMNMKLGDTKIKRLEGVLMNKDRISLFDGWKHS